MLSSLFINDCIIIFKKTMILCLLSLLKGFVNTKHAFGLKWKIKIILLFSLFLLLFMGPTALFGTIYELHYTISINFYLYL